MAGYTPSRAAVTGGLFGFIGMSVIAGLLVTAALTPAVAIGSVAASNGIALFENLPSYLDVSVIPQRSTIYAKKADGSYLALASFYDENREALSWDEVPQVAKNAAIAGEDRRFYEHGGVDLQGTIRALFSNASGAEVQGGSTITQQFVKNVLITQGVALAKTDEERKAAYELAAGSTPDRKLKEMRYAIAIEKKFTKDQILLGYLNIAYFGSQVYGIEAASQYYYGIHAKDLTAAQAASLIAIVQNPDRFQLDNPKSETNGAANGYAANRSRRDFILRSMQSLGMLSDAEATAALASKIEPKLTSAAFGCQTAAGAAYFCDYVSWIIKRDFDDPNTPDVNEGFELLRRGGLSIYSTLDLDLQQASEAAMKSYIPASDPRLMLGAAAVSVEVGTGRVLAMAQNTGYTQSAEVAKANPGMTAVNFSTDQDYGSSGGFQAGSGYKVFTLGDWLNEGHSLGEQFNGAPRPFSTFLDSCNGGKYTLPQPWNPRNDVAGEVANDAVAATAQSVNTAYVAMATQLDLCKIKQTAQAFGIHRADGAPLQMNPSDVLGTQEVAPLTMAAAYAGISNDGLFCSPVAIDRITDATGADLPAPKTTCAQAVSADVAHGMQYAMQRVFSGTAAPSQSRLGGSRIAHIGKTGTTDNAYDTWMNGASTKVSTSVWVGNYDIDANRQKHSLRSMSVNGTQIASLRHWLWPSIMKVADAKFGGKAFTPPPARLLEARSVPIPNVIGLTSAAAQAALTAAGFSFVDGGTIDSALAAGSVASISPAGTAPRGAEITVRVSNGSLVNAPEVVGHTQADATALLTAAPYNWSVVTATQQVTDPTKVGTVVAQSLAAGTPAKPGSTTVVTLTIGAP